MADQPYTDISENPPGMPGENPQGMPGAPMQSQEKPEHKKGVITFGGSKKPQVNPEVVKLTSQMGEMGRRIRILEDRYSNVRRKTQVTDQNMLSIQKSLSREIKAIDSEIVELQRNVEKIDENVKQILREIQNFADIDQVKVLKRYLDFWQPLNFLTKDEAEKLVKQIVEENRKI